VVLVLTKAGAKKVVDADIVRGQDDSSSSTENQLGKIGGLAMAFRMTGSNEELRNEESKTNCSKRKLRANRDNAQRSTGPKSTRRTRHNAVRHGLLCDGISELDLSAGYSELLDQLIAEKKPAGRIETHLIESIGLYMIRIRRTRCLEAQFLNQ